MQISDIFEELLTIYNEEWFNTAKDKFFNHPSNHNKANEFIGVSCEESDDGVSWKEKTIDLYKFLLGATNEHFDDIFSEQQEDNNLIQVGELPNGYPDFELKEGHTYTSSSSFYPTPNLQQWQLKINKEIRICLNLLGSLKEKDLFYDMVLYYSKERKEKIKESKDEEYKELIFRFIDDFQTKIIQVSEKISYLQGIVGEHESLIHFNLTQAKLARFLYLLINKKYFKEGSTRAIATFFIKHSTVTFKNSQKTPSSLETEMKRLSSKKYTNKRKFGKQYKN
jgi:hypothetical protein